MKLNVKRIFVLFCSSVLCHSVSASDYKGMYGRTLPADGNVNMQTAVDVETVLNLAGNNMLGMLDPTRDYLPYWSHALSHMGTWQPSHNLGRWWDAVLSLEASIGFTIPANAEAGMLGHLYRFFDNPDHRIYPPFDETRFKEGEPQALMHDLRENLMALNALIRFRNSNWARHKGRLMIGRLLIFLNEDGTWNFDKMLVGKERGEKIPGICSDPTTSHGRLLEAVIIFYNLTGDYSALKLAGRIANYHIKNSVNPDGSFNRTSGAYHAHSYLGTLRGLLMYGELTGQHKYIDVVAKTFTKTALSEIVISQAGYTPHNIGDIKIGGETSSPGDAAQIALWLAKRHGCTELLDDTERLIRARIVPAQITNTGPLTPSPDHDGDAVRDLEQRIIGAIGGVHGPPHGGKTCVTDVTAAGIHTLVDIYNNIVDRTQQDVKIYLHFDIENDYIALKSRRAEKATLNIDMKINANLWVRMPQWVPADSIKVMQNGKPLTYEKMGDFLVIANEFSPGTITVTYDLPVVKKQETIGETTYTLLWRGDEVIGISPNVDFSPFYPDLPERYRDNEVNTHEAKN